MKTKGRDRRRLTDGELLNHNQLSSFLLLRDLREVDGDLRARDADTHAIDHAARDQRAHTVTRDLHARPREPPETGEHDGITTTDPVGDRASDSRSDDGSRGQSATDGTLCDPRRPVEVIVVLFRSDDGRHGGDVEAEEHAADCSDERYEQRIVDLGKFRERHLGG
jgi:hypothetical protein